MIGDTVKPGRCQGFSSLCISHQTRHYVHVGNQRPRFSISFLFSLCRIKILCSNIMDIFSNPTLADLLNHPLLLHDDQPSTIGLLEWDLPPHVSQPSASWEPNMNDDVVTHVTVCLTSFYPFKNSTRVSSCQLSHLQNEAVSKLRIMYASSYCITLRNF